MLRAALVAVFALALPASASAQLRSLCTSPTANYCMTFWTWEYGYRAGTVPDETGFGNFFFQAEVEFWGHLVDETNTVRFGFEIYDACCDQENDWKESLPGMHTMGDGAGGNLLIGQPTVYDIAFLKAGGWDGGPVVERCSTDVGLFVGVYDPCYEPVSVPEPSSLLLLATGLVGLGYGYRGRRRA